jgi:hypothetical protein
LVPSDYPIDNDSGDERRDEGEQADDESANQCPKERARVAPDKRVVALELGGLRLELQEYLGGLEDGKDASFPAFLDLGRREWSHSGSRIGQPDTALVGGKHNREPAILPLHNDGKRRIEKTLDVSFEKGNFESHSRRGPFEGNERVPSTAFADEPAHPAKAQRQAARTGDHSKTGGESAIDGVALGNELKAARRALGPAAQCGVSRQLGILTDSRMAAPRRSAFETSLFLGRFQRSDGRWKFALVGSDCG